MPRYIESAVGSRSIVIPEQTDLFANTATVQDGSPMLVADARTTGSPQYCHAYDRAAGNEVYAFYGGQARTIVVWVENFDLANSWPWVGCAPVTAPTVPNWYIDRVSGSGARRFMLRNGSASYNQLTMFTGGSSDGGSPEMLACSFTGVSGGANNVQVYWNGAYSTQSTLTCDASYLAAPAFDMQFFFGRAANQPLSTINPTTSATGEVHLAKLSVFDAVLTPTEIGDLYLAMT